MNQEIINRIEVTDANELFLGITGVGSNMYQYIYREAAGVYWDEKNYGFKSTELKKWGHSKWFSHIVSVVKSGLGVELQLSNSAVWGNIPEQEKEIITNEYAAI